MSKIQSIAILGATSQIARDLIVSYSADKDVCLHLFARAPDEVEKWLIDVGLIGRYLVNNFNIFGEQEFDAVINFVGVGNPAQAVAIGNAIFNVTLQFDEMVLKYLKAHPACRYLFLSSGAVYGTNFSMPVTQNTPSIIAINNLAPQEWYGIAKLHAECRHRAYPELHIIDIRVFNYFSKSQDIEAKFLITDIIRAIRDSTVLKTLSNSIVRDYLHSTDFFQLVVLLLSSPPTNDVVDCYTLAPIKKLNLLQAMKEKFGLQYEITDESIFVNATGDKPYYYSMNRRAENFGYRPKLTSLECVLLETEYFISVIK